MELPAATFTVTSINDSGPGSLRQAILDANAAGDLDTIQFLLPGAAPFTISPAAALPPLAAPVVLDATTQPGYTASPVVELNGISAGAGVVGLRVTGGGCTIRGLAINRFSGDGIRLDSGKNVIAGNYIGTDVTGSLARGNGQSGILLLGASTNVIGGTNLADRNVISGHNDTGIYILDGRANVVQGNYIGLNAAGTADLGNANNGIAIYNAPANTVGGLGPGARNVISGNDASGINLNSALATSNAILGNYIGVNAAGTAAIGNTADGITLNDAPANFIGGTDPGAGNLISGNAQSGIDLTGTTARNNLIAGNSIGTDAAGTTALGNGLDGVTLWNSVSNYIGSLMVESRNVISGNRQAGILLSTNSIGNQIQNNFIGVAANGTNALGNALEGIELVNANFNQIGSPGAGNVISGNLNNGVRILGGGASNNFVQGNYIGTDVSGSHAVKNGASGVQVLSPANQIGGNAPGTGNLISGNGGIGVWLFSSSAAGNFVRGNLIGTTVGGTNGLGNAVGGIGLTDAASNQIGGFTVAERNLISANGTPGTQGGIFVVGAKATGNRFYGNFIGTDITGQTALANRYEGIYIGGASSNIIGSELAGGGNLISGNGTRGILLNNASWNVVQGNFLGMAADGETGLSNGYGFPTSSGFSMIDLTSSSNNLIGGTNSRAGNRIGFAPVLLSTYYAGVRVRDGSVNNAVLGNSLFSNGGLGIDLSNYGLTDNDAFAACDSDTGGNLRQNFPVLLEALTGSNTRVRGYLHGASGQAYRLQFFSNPTCDSSPLVSGYGEGKTFLGETTIVLGGVCSNSFTAFLTGGVPAGYFITATATDPANNTSEFSACRLVMAAPQLSFAPAGSDQVSLAWTNPAPGFVLQETSDLTPPINWITVTNLPVLVASQFTVTLSRQPGNWFYRLSLE